MSTEVNKVRVNDAASSLSENCLHNVLVGLVGSQYGTASSCCASCYVGKERKNAFTNFHLLCLSEFDSYKRWPVCVQSGLTHYFPPRRASSLTKAFVVGKNKILPLSLSPLLWQPAEIGIFEAPRSTRGPSVTSGDENDPDHLVPLCREVQLSTAH